MTESNWYKVTIYNDGIYFTVNTFTTRDNAVIDAQKTIERVTGYDPLWAGSIGIEVIEPMESK
jgi:hypothetical protein